MKQKQLFYGALISYGAMAFNIISGLLYTPWMIREIGDDQYALFTLALSVINLFLMDFGIGSAVSKFLSQYYARGEQEKANRFMGVVYKVFFLISAVIAVCLTVVYFCIDIIYVKLTPAELTTFKTLFILVGFSSVVLFPCAPFNGALMAGEQFIAAKACDFGQKVFTVVLIVTFLLLGYGLYAMVLVHVCSNVVFALIKYICLRKGTAVRADFSGAEPGMGRQLFHFSFWSTISAVAQRGMNSIMPTIIAATIGSTEITLFTLGAALEGYVYSFAQAINGMFLPRISRIFARSEEVGRELTLLMSRVGRFHIYTIGLLFIGFVSIGSQFVVLWLGEGYHLVYICAVILIFPCLISLPQQVAGSALLANDIIKESAIIQIVKAATNIVVSFLMIPFVGIAGAALSITFANLVAIGASNWLYHKYLPVNLPQYFQIVYGRWSIVALLTVLGWQVLSRWWRPGGWLGLLEQAVVIGLIYAVLTLTIGMRRDEKQHLWEHVQRLLQSR